MKNGKIHGTYISYHLQEDALEDIAEMNLMGRKFVEFVSKLNLGMP